MTFISLPAIGIIRSVISKWWESQTAFRFAVKGSPISYTKTPLRIAIDFDNTIVDYDALFLTVAASMRRPASVKHKIS